MRRKGEILGLIVCVLLLLVLLYGAFRILTDFVLSEQDKQEMSDYWKNLWNESYNGSTSETNSSMNFSWAILLNETLRGVINESN